MWIKTVILLLIASCLFAVEWPLQIVGDHLEDQNGVPFFICGDSPWSIINGTTYAEATTYLDNRQSKGVTAIIVRLIDRVFGPNAPNNHYNEPPFNTPGDFDTPHEDYFVFCDSIINMAKSRDMVVFLAPCYVGYGCGSQGWNDEMDAEGTAGCGRWGAWVGNRYKDFNNIIWVGGGDAIASECGTDAEMTAIMDSLLYYDTDGLATAHSYRGESGKDGYNHAWLTMNSTYTDAGSVESEVNTTFGQNLFPAFYIEGAYEGEGGTAESMFAQFYTSVLYGDHVGSMFGNTYIWEFKSGWTNNLNTDGAEYLQYFGALFRSRPFWLLEPDRSHTVITANYTNSVAMASDSSCMIAYSYDSRTYTVDMNEISGDSAKAWWYNPETGAETFIDTYITSGNRNFATGGTNVLVIDDYTVDFPNPGQGIYTEEEQTPSTVNGLLIGGGNGKIY